MSAELLNLIREESSNIASASDDHPLSLSAAQPVTQAYDIPQI